MNKPIGEIALSACLLLLAACDKAPPAAPSAPIADRPVPAEPAAASGSETDPSLPPAETVFPPASNPTDPETTETDGTRKPAMAPEDQPTEKPIPGQNNDHSAPLSTDE